MASVNVLELLLGCILISVVLVVLYTLIKSAKEFKDYERIRDYLVIGTLMWLIGTFGYDSSLRNAGMCIYGYGLLLLLYNHYRKGYEEGLNVRKSGGNSS